MQDMEREAKEERYRYLDVSRKDQRWNLFLNAAGRILHRSPGTPDRGHPAPYYYQWNDGRTLPGYGIAYVTQGQGEFETEEAGLQTIRSGTMFLLFPEVWHRYRPSPETGWSYHWLHCDGSYMQHLVHNKLITPKDPILKIGLNGQLLRSFLTLQERVANDPPGLQQLAAGNVIEILGSALASSPKREMEDELQAIVFAAKATLEQQIGEPIELKGLASSFGISYDYFRRIFREQIGIAPYQFYLNLRLDRAKELLCSTDMTIQEIALALQFDTQNYFARIFRKKTGMSPTKWRAVSRESLPNTNHL